MAKKPGTAVANWREELREAAAEEAASQRSGGGGQSFFSMKAGVLSYDGEPMPGNRMAVIVIANTLENSYYDEPFAEGQRVSPKCFAFARKEGDLEPHEAVDQNDYFERQADSCPECPMNQYGTARTGKGKACSNVMRLAVIPAGTFSETGKGRARTIEFDGLIEDADHFESAAVAFMKVPVMSVKNFAAYVKELAAEDELPPFAVFTEIYLEPDAKSQFKVCFEKIDDVPDELMQIVMARHKKEQANIAFPYNPPAAEADEDAPAPKGLKKRK